MKKHIHKYPVSLSAFLYLSFPFSLISIPQYTFYTWHVNDKFDRPSARPPIRDHSCATPLTAASYRTKKVLIPALSLPKSASSINYVYYVRGKDFQDQSGRLGTLSAAEHELPSSWLGNVSEMFYLLLPGADMCFNKTCRIFPTQCVFAWGLFSTSQQPAQGRPR